MELEKARGTKETDPKPIKANEMSHIDAYHINKLLWDGAFLR